jgi:hypothetical protein
MRRLLRFMIPAVVVMGFAERAAEAQSSPPQGPQSSFAQSAASAHQQQDMWNGRWNSAPIQPPVPGYPIPAIPVPQYSVGPQGGGTVPPPLPPQMGAMAPGQTYTQTYAQPAVQTTTVQSYAMAGGAMFSVTILSVPVVTTTTTEYVTETVARSARRTVRRAPHRRACTCRVVCQ